MRKNSKIITTFEKPVKFTQSKNLTTIHNNKNETTKNIRHPNPNQTMTSDLDHLLNGLRRDDDGQDPFQERRCLVEVEEHEETVGDEEQHAVGDAGPELPGKRTSKVRVHCGVRRNRCGCSRCGCMGSAMADGLQVNVKGNIEACMFLENNHT